MFFYGVDNTKYQELGESKKLPDIQLKKDVITKDMQGNRITLSEGDVFSVYELPKSRYLLEGKESYTNPKNQFQKDLDRGRISIKEKIVNKGIFKSSHWDGPNVLFHLKIS